MSSFLERTFALLAHQPDIICAVLGTSRKIMNCSAVPVVLSSDKTWDSLCSEKANSEQEEHTQQKLLRLFSAFSDTMQFTEKLRIRNILDKDVLKTILQNLIKNKRYFTRTIRLLHLPSAALTDACCPDPSSTTNNTGNKQKHQQQKTPATTPILFSNLRSLTIEGYCYNQHSEQLKTICSSCPFLEELNIPDKEKLTDAGAECLSNLKHLKSLNLSKWKLITDRGLQHLAKLSSLQTLNLTMCDKITDVGLLHLAKLSSLQTLDLRHCDNITDNGLEHLVKLSSLRSLNLTSCTEITDSGLQHLAKLTSIQSLSFGTSESITDNGLKHLAKLSSLRSLDFCFCEEITDNGLQQLAHLSSSLQTLDLRSCNLITGSGLQHLSQLSFLRSLNLPACPGISDNGPPAPGEIIVPAIAGSFLLR